MEFQVINRNRNAVIPEGMFKLCGMEDAKLISRCSSMAAFCLCRRV